MIGSNVSESHGESEDEIDLRQLLFSLLAGKWVILGCLLAGVAVGLAYLQFTTPVFRATALLEVPEQRENAAGFEVQDYTGDEVLKTIERNLRRISLIGRVVERENIGGSAAFQASFEDSPDIQGTPRQWELVAEWVSISLERGTRLINVSVEHTDRMLARDLANALVEEFIRERSEKRSGSTASAVDSLMREAERIGGRLRKSQALLQKLDEAVKIQNSVKENEDELSSLRQRYADAHPSVLQLRSLIEEKNADLDLMLKEIRPLVSEHSKITVATDGSVTRPPDENKLLAKEEFEFLFAHRESLSGEVATSQALFESVLARLEEMDVSSQLDVESVEISEDAYLPSEPVKPKGLFVLAAGVLFGSGLGFVLVAGSHFLDNKLRTVDRAEQKIGLPVMASIPEDKRIQKKIEPLVMLSDPGSPVAEAFRSLRASLALQDFSSYNSNDKGRSSRTILITSSLPGEGKSFVSSNLAVAYASQLNMKTLLIEADLRRPVMERIFGLKTPGAGTVGALSDLEKWETAVVESGIPNLDLLTGGQNSTDRPAELLGSIQMNHLLKKAVERYDRVVIDSTPVNSVSDALLFGSEVDNAILVADASRTPASSVKRAKTQLGGSVREISGLVLNRMPQKAGSVADPYHYYYTANDAYGESYSRKDKS